jgi:hypothetical protein
MSLPVMGLVGTRSIAAERSATQHGMPQARGMAQLDDLWIGRFEEGRAPADRFKSAWLRLEGQMGRRGPTAPYGRVGRAR